MGFCCIGAEVDDFVFFVEGAVWVGDGDGVESGEDEVRWVVYEMFRYLRNKNVSLVVSLVLICVVIYRQLTRHFDVPLRMLRSRDTGVKGRRKFALLRRECVFINPLVRPVLVDSLDPQTSCSWRLLGAGQV